MRKLLSSVSAIAVAGVLAYGVANSANQTSLPLLSGPACAEAGAQLQCLNAVIQAIYSGVTGNFAYVPGPITNTGTSSTTANFVLASAIIPTGSITGVNQGYRARCAGTYTLATSVKFGIAVGRSMQVSLENLNTNNPVGNQPNWDLEIQFLSATQPATGSYTWMSRAFAGNATGGATGQVSVISGVDVTGDNNNLQAIPVTCVLYGQQLVTGAATMMNFSVEQLR